VHGYYLTYKTAIGETDPKGPISITTTAGNNTVTLTLPISTDERVIARKIYRTKVGSIYNEYLLVTINDNTTTTYVDTADDSTLTAEYRNSYYRANTTTNYITVGGVKAMTVDPKATYFGFNAGVSATSAGYNAFFGSDAGRYNTTGKSNTFIGYQAGYANTAGDANVVIGAQAGYNATGHVNSTIIGSLAGRYYNSGASNIATTTNSVFLGMRSYAATATPNNAIVIGFQAESIGNNTVVLGNDSIVTTALKGNVLINTTTDAGYKLDVNGTARVSGTTTITPAALTGTAATSALDIAQTWNTTGAPTALKLNVTNTASSTLSYLLDLQINGSSLFRVQRQGRCEFSSRIVDKLNLLGVVSVSTSLAGNEEVFFSSRTLNPTSGGRTIFSAGGVFNPTSGTANFNGVTFTTTINQTGGATGITRGLYINPTLTSAADFRAIETTAGNVLFGASGTGFFWDDTNNRLGIGTASPTAQLDVKGNVVFGDTSTNQSSLVVSTPYSNTSAVNMLSLKALGKISIVFGPGGVQCSSIGSLNISNQYFESGLFFSTATGGVLNERMRIVQTGNVLINTTTDAGYKLDVNGTARVQGRFSLTTGQFLTVSGTTVNGLYSANINTLQIYNRNIPISTIYSAGGESSFGIQIAYNSAGTPPNNLTAILDLTSTTKGFLPPRMTTTQKNAIATPAAGLVVYDTDLNQLCTYDGTWGDSPFYQQSLRGVRFFTDFDSSTKYDNFVSLTSGVAASTARLTNFVPNQTANQIGIAHYQTGTATTGWAMHITEQSANAQQFQFGGGTWMYESYIEVDILSDATNRFRFISGFGNVASSGTETNGAFFTYDEGGVSNGTIASPNWQCVTTVGAVRTLTTTSVAVTTTWTKLRIIVNADATEVKFYIDGTLVATHTTNIPVLPNRLKVKQMIAKLLGTGNRFVYCDYIFYENNLTTLR
jgi:hypothetical protein